MCIDLPYKCASKYIIAYFEVDEVFFFVGPVCISSGSPSAFKAYCAYPKFS
jgi:hypothetical protein